jgi:nitrosocyanin
MNSKTLIGIIIVVLVIVGVVVYAKSKNTSSTSTSTDTMQMDSDGDEPMVSPAASSTDTTGVSADATVNVTTGNVKSFTVTGSNFKFAPTTLSVKKGDTVKITFVNSSGFHDFRIDEFKVATKQIKSGSQETVSFVADKAGTFEYYCSVGNHRAMGMKGTLTVAE